MQQRKHRPLAARTLNRPRHTGEKQWPNELVRPRKSLTEEPDNLSGKRPTKTKVLVVYRRGFVRSGVLSLIAKSMGFAVRAGASAKAGAPGRAARLRTTRLATHFDLQRLPDAGERIKLHDEPYRDQKRCAWAFSQRIGGIDCIHFRTGQRGVV